MNLRERWIFLLYKAATGARRTRVLLTPIGVTVFGAFTTLFVLAALLVDRLLELPGLLPEGARLPVSIPLIAVGVAVTAWSAFHFLRVQGTPVPFNPPSTVVTTGPYRYARNPMVTGVFLLLFGIGFAVDSISLVCFFTPLYVLINVWELKQIEEPELVKRLGQEYIEYRSRTPMLLPGRRSSDVKPLAPLLLAFASVGCLALATAPAVSPAEAQGPPPEQTGGLARTDAALGDIGQPVDMPASTAQQKALTAYHRGLEYRDKAWLLEKQAALSAGRRSARKAAKAHRAHEKSIEHFRQAVTLVPSFAQALGGLGYALLETGQYEEAVAAYDRALAIGPRYPEAIAERGEAYLGLDRIEEAKSAYIELVPVDRESAAELMTAMKRWLDQRRGDAGGISEETLERFAAWIEERSWP